MDSSAQKTLRVFAATWNVAAQRPPAAGSASGKLLQDMLLRGTTNVDPHDIYVISLQEIVDLDIINICFSSAETEIALQQWSELLLALLNPADGGRFSLLRKIAVVGTGLIVLVKDEHLMSSHIKPNSVITASLNLGKFYLGNKAAVAIRMCVGNTAMCFVSAHFAAHRGSVASKMRVEHLSYTMQHLKFPGVEYQDVDFRRSVREGTTTHPTAESPLLDNVSSMSSSGPSAESLLGIGDHDFVVLLGDLNSRMREEISENDVWSLIDAYGKDSATPMSSEDVATLLSWDELWYGPMLAALRDLGFREGAVSFGPTYKLNPGSSFYHVPPAGKPNKVFNHCPAWCDRILWSKGWTSSMRPGDIHVRAGEPI